MDGSARMTDQTKTGQVQLGDPVPWFDARNRLPARPSASALSAGRWIVLCFLER